MRTRIKDGQCASTIYCGDFITKDTTSGITTHTPQVYTPEATRRYLSIERTDDELHPGPPFDSGGPFSNWKGSDGGLVLSDYSVISRKLGAYEYTYKGMFLQLLPPINFNLGLFKDPNYSGWSANGINDISSYGPVGWKMYQPIKPVVDLGQDLYEIREIPKMIKNTATFVKEAYTAYKDFKRSKVGGKFAGEQWLNLNFGWVPLVSSIKKLVDYTDKCQKKYQYLKENNGKWRKRGGVVLRESNSSLVSTTGYPTSAVWPKPTTALYAPDYYTRISNRLYLDSYRDIWFEGCFRFYIPDLGEYEDWSKDYRSRLGLNPSPKLVWELTPWSWLIDWFTNFGDVVENLQNSVANPVVAKYAYVMGYTRNYWRYESLFPFWGKDIILNRVYKLERKQRVGANPFGFGLTYGQLSPWQWSILGALGISRIH